MSEKKKSKERHTDEEAAVSAPAEGKDTKPAKKKKKELIELFPSPVESKISFDQWVAIRAIKPGHVAGMRSFVKAVNVKRTAKQWDELFKNY